MTKVGFYVLRCADEAQRLHLAARLTEKAHNQGHKVYIHTPDETLARHMDELLWSFRADSFLPHGLLGDGNDENIAIGWQNDSGTHNDFLINLDLSPPRFFSRFSRLAEVVTQQPEQLTALRRSWVFYKDRGYELSKHDM